MTSSEKTLRFLHTAPELIAAAERGELAQLQTSPVVGTKLHDVRGFWTETQSWTSVKRLGPVQYRRLLGAML